MSHQCWQRGDNSIGYQLRRFVEAAELIRRTVQKRVGPKSQRHRSNHEFFAVVNDSLGALPDDSDDAEIETEARCEKAAALEEIFASRLSVLIGAAGTGKTTLLKMVCELEDVAAGGILLLAPTGKARVQLETRTGITGGLTIAQFLMLYGDRYDTETGRYVMTGSPDRCRDYRTVIVDECSMLTERAARRSAGRSERRRPFGPRGRSAPAPPDRKRPTVRGCRERA